MNDPVKELSVAAVVVTYNRLELLTEAIAALRSQTAAFRQLIVINNGSTDNTARWLEAQPGLLVISQANSGGAGGFYTGIRQAVTMEADFVWVMDDDTVCEPTALEKMLEKIALIKEPVGFIGSRCNWTDGSPHLMNLPPIKPLFNKIIPFNKYDRHQVLLTETGSFVSLLINTQVVKQVGLPYKEFFIWGDDQEYTRRITKAGYLGFYCSSSIALHKTPVNYFPDFYRDDARNLWKYKMGFRNEFFMIKKNKGFLYFMCWLPAKLLYTSFKVLRIRSDHHLKFIGVLITAAWNSVFFKPRIEMVTPPSIPIAPRP